MALLAAATALGHVATANPQHWRSFCRGGGGGGGGGDAEALPLLLRAAARAGSEEVVEPPLNVNPTETPIELYGPIETPIER